jgi:signal transduction histidine kinase
MKLIKRLELRVVREMTLRRRLVITLGCMALILVLPSLYAIERIDEIRDIAFELKGRHSVADVALSRLQTNLGEVDAALRSYIADPDPESRATLFESLGKSHTELAELADAGYAEEAAETAATLERLEDVTLQLETLVHDGRVAEATDFFFEEIQPVFAEAEAAVLPVVEAVGRSSEAATERAADLSSSTATTIPLAVLFSLGFAMVIGMLIIGQLVTPLQQLRAAMSRVAQGDFEAPPELATDRPDELGDLNRSFVSMTEQLAELNRLRAEFVSIVTHDLKTPINVLGGYAEMLQEGTYGGLSEEQRGVLGAMEEQVGVLLEQVNQLVDLSRYEAGAYRIQLEELHVVDLCTSLKRAFEALARQKGIRLSFELDPKAPRTIYADIDRLRNEVLSNLLANSFKFTEAGGRISVRIRPDHAVERPGQPVRGERVVIEVSDSGVGIPADELPHVFDMYYQGENGVRAKGSGIGLAIAKEIVEAHSGEITVESEGGRGATFRIRLPATAHGRTGHPDRRAAHRDERTLVGSAERNGVAAARAEPPAPPDPVHAAEKPPTDAPEKLAAAVSE